MKKTSFLTVLLLTLVSCGETRGTLSKFEKVENALNCQSEALQNMSTNFDEERVNIVKEQLFKAIENQNASLVNRYLEEAYYYLFSCADKRSVAQARYYSTLSESYEKRNDDLYLKYLEIFNWLEDAEKAAYDLKNKEIIKIFFEDKTDEEIEKYIQNLVTSDELDALTLQMIEIMNRINVESSNRPDDETYFNDGIDAFYEYAPLCDEYASYYGYDSYLDYVHKADYSRKYDLTDGITLAHNFKERYKDTYEKYDLSDYSEEQAKKLKLFTSGSVFRKDNDLCKIIDDYSSCIGGAYNDLYTHVFNDGYYCFSDNEHSLGSAFSTYLYLQDEPLLYFSSEFQDLFSIVHEFGHAFAFKTPNNDYASYDIGETYSQANEMLLCSYISNNNDDYKDACDYYINNFAGLLFKIASTVEIENYLFSNYKTLTKDQMKANIKDIVASYNGLTSNVYWIATTICTTGYYVSYLTSGITSLCMYEDALEDFNLAKNNYLSFVTGYDGKMSDVDHWKKYNFDSPFDLSSFEKIDNLYGK